MSCLKGYRCYHPECGISAMADFREGGKPVLFGAHLTGSDQSPIPTRSVLCSTHLQLAIAAGRVSHYRPLNEMLVDELSKYTLGLIAEQMEKIEIQILQQEYWRKKRESQTTGTARTIPSDIRRQASM